MERIIRTVCPHDCPDACSILATVEDGHLLRTKGDPEHPFTDGFLCGKVQRYSERVYSPQRLLTPLRRVGRKGEGAFSPISWDEALDEIICRWQALVSQYGGESIAGYAYSAHQGLINRNLPQALFHALGATRVNAATVCDACNGDAWELTTGSLVGTDPEQVAHSDLIISWGANLDTTNVHLLPFIAAARKNGAKFIVIDAWRTRTARRADWFIPIRVGTDAALGLGIAHVLQREGLVDRDYVDRLVVGYDRWSETVLPRYPPDKVADLTGIAPEVVVELAMTYGRAKASFIRLGQGMSRHLGGGMAVRAIACLPALTGAWKQPGGGALLSTAGAFSFNFDAVRRPDLQPGTCRTLNLVRLGRALLEWQTPPLLSLFVQSNNPAVTCPQQDLVRRGLAREDLFTVVHDTFMSDTARYADLVLPACTSFESEDLYRSYGAYYVQYGPQVLQPQGDAWSNYRLIGELAKRLGLKDAVFYRRPKEHIAALLEVDNGPITGITVDEVLTGAPQRLHVPASGHTFDHHFPTPSGKLQIACPDLVQLGLPELPDYLPDSMPPSSMYPLRLLTAPGHHLHHSSFIGVDSLLRREGGPWMRLHPDDAAFRNIEDGQPVELFNDAGCVGLYAMITTDVPRGVVVVEGHRAQSHYLSGGPLNVLCSDAYSDIAEGATYQSTWLEARPLVPSPS